jgi:hypothetical protein
MLPAVNSVGNSTALLIYFFENSYDYFDKTSCTTLQQKVMIPD